MSFPIKDEENSKYASNEEYLPLIQDHAYSNKINLDFPYFCFENDYAPNIDSLTLNDIMRHENISYDENSNMDSKVLKKKDTIVPIPEDAELCFRKQSGLQSLASKYFIPKSLDLRSFLNPLKHANNLSYNLKRKKKMASTSSPAF
jgi:hypothetical protein